MSRKYGNPALQPTRLDRAIRWGVVAYILLLVAVPLTTLVLYGFSDGVAVFWDRVTGPIAFDALLLTLWTAVLVGVINTFLGTATAWVLVRYRFAGKALLSAVIDLPFAIPTLVAGVMLAILYGEESFLGPKLGALGIPIASARPGIVLALLFVTLPFVVRAVEPVLEEVDPAEEEAAVVLGAGPFRVFWTVFLRAIMPASISGGIRSIGRAVGEFGSISVIAGNIPFSTQTAPVYIYGEIESGTPQGAAALSSVLLFIALLLHALARFVESRTGERSAVN